MNIRNIYWGLIIVLSGLLLFEWTSQKREQSIDSHLDYAEFFNTSGYGEGYSIIENDKLFCCGCNKNRLDYRNKTKRVPRRKCKGVFGFSCFLEAQQKQRSITTLKAVSLESILYISCQRLGIVLLFLKILKKI